MERLKMWWSVYWNLEWRVCNAKAYTDNPAWIFYDILSNNRYGIGEFIDESLEIDKFFMK